MQAHRLLNLDRSDAPRLRLLAPTFAMTAAATVVMASLSKALFLASSPITLLPWMFLGSAAITAAGSMVYVALMDRFALRARYRALLALSVVVLLSLRAAYPLHPKSVGVAVLLLAPTLGHLVVVQCWNMASSLLPTRQGKRLFPVLAAITTLGAVAGGLSVQLLLHALSTADLLVVAALALAVVLLGLGRAIDALIALTTSTAGTIASAMREVRAEQTEGAQKGSEVRRGLTAIVRSALLSELSLFVFLLQGSSLIIDYQFSAELKPALGVDAMASFLGTYYWSSNLLVLVLTLLVTGRLVRRLGIGLSLGASAVALGLGSMAYAGSAITGAASTFWVIAATAFAERVAQYALTKPAMQMVYMPLQTRGGERAKTLIDGVIVRLATATVSVLLLVAAPALAEQHQLSIPAAIACAAAVALSLRVGPHYRAAIFEALESRRLDADTTRYLETGLKGPAADDVVARLDDPSPPRVRRALELIAELEIDVDATRLERLVDHADEAVASQALELLTSRGTPPSATLLARLLDPSRPPPVLQAALRILSEHTDHATQEAPALADGVRALTRHTHPGVAAAACVFRLQAAGQTAMQGWQRELAPKGDDAPKALPRRITGLTRAGAFARELPALLEGPDPEARRRAIAQMGALALPHFVPPLLACLARPAARDLALNALSRYGEAVVPAAHAHAEDPEAPAVARVAAVRLIERLPSEAAVDALQQLAGPRSPVQNAAVGALWRIAREGGAARAPKAAVLELLGAERERLKRLVAVEAATLGRATERRMFFARELRATSEAAETRVFRLLGLIHDREAMQRAFLHYRSADTQTRSNAIELLDQHVRAPELRALVALLERAEDENGRLRPRSIAYQGVDASAIELLETEGTDLAALHRWMEDDPEDGDSPFDRALALHRVPMLSELDRQQLSAVDRAATRIDFEEGDTIEGASAGRVVLVVDGRVELAIAPERAAQAHGCVGLAEALAAGEGSADAVAVAPGSALAFDRDAFLDLVDAMPALLRGLVPALTAQLRSVSDARLR